MLNGYTLDDAHQALQYIPADMPRDGWHKVGRAAIAAGVDVDALVEWSRNADNYKSEQDVRAAFRTVKADGGTGAGTLFKIAIENGWSKDDKQRQHKPTQATRRPQEPPRKPSPGMSPAEVWARCEQATNAHPYIVKKQAQGVPLDGLRVLPADDRLSIGGVSMAGTLFVPAYAPDGTLQSAQLIPTTGKKMNLPGSPMAGSSFTVGDTVPGGVAYIVEGIGQAWACWQATGAAAVVCFGAGNMGKAAAALRARDATARLVLVPDVGKEHDADKIAREVGAAVAYMPPGEVNNFDANDLAQRDGGDVLAELLERARQPAPPPLPLSVAFADELGDTFTPFDELVEGVLTAGDGSVLYGDSNSGKTFLMIDMACAVARGVEWMGRKTEPGLVVYLAAESPASVRSRLQAYQKHHGVKVPNFAIVQSPIDLFDGDADTDKVIQVVRQLEQQRGQKARLIIGDTLARLSAGANENAGQDMGLVVRRFDRIRTECKAHFCLIHHSGKSAAAGARGWSGVRAAVDTEIEISDSPTGRCCEITKQRDLSTKGDRIGFRLDPVTLGFTKWGAAATSCVVVAADAPEKKSGKRMGEVEGAVVEFLAAHKVGIRKAEVVKHFEGRYEKGPIYRAMKTLVTAAAIHEAAGMVVISGAAK
jgi:KaiC/GvpD/RAD55 family RecA-like ATPase